MLARGPTATFLDACAWKLIYVPYQYPDGRPKLFWYDTYVLRNCNCSVLTIGPPYRYVIPPHICYQYSYILIQSNMCIDCTTVTVMLLPLVVLTDTERWLDGLLFCSRYWIFITTIDWCCVFLDTPPEWKSRLQIMLLSQTNAIVTWKSYLLT